MNVGDGEGVEALVALAVGTEEVAVGSGLDVGRGVGRTGVLVIGRVAVTWRVAGPALHAARQMRRKKVMMLLWSFIGFLGRGVTQGRG